MIKTTIELSVMTMLTALSRKRDMVPEKRSMMMFINRWTLSLMRLHKQHNF